MLLVKNLNKTPITTITAGNICFGEEKLVADWEGAFIERLHTNIEIKTAKKSKGKK